MKIKSDSEALRAVNLRKAKPRPIPSAAYNLLFSLIVFLGLVLVLYHSSRALVTGAAGKEKRSNQVQAIRLK